MKKFTILASTLAASTLSLSLVGGISKAQATSLVPTTEGEIHLTNVGCLSGVNCIETNPLGYTVTSLPYDTDGINPQYGLSRLFVDQRSTANNYGFGITFLGQDEGTNPSLDEYFFRPIAYLADTSDAQPEGVPAENGRLEVGQYKFDFANIIGELELTFFDTEQNGTTIVKKNGVNFLVPITPGSDGNIRKIKLTDVQSFEVQLGSIGGAFNHGDGVDLQASVPEPGTTVSLGALVLTALFGLQKRKKSSQAV
jgi:hypothetical protein